MLVQSLAGIHLQESKHFSTVKMRISDSGECKLSPDYGHHFHGIQALQTLHVKSNKKHVTLA